MQYQPSTRGEGALAALEQMDRVPVAPPEPRATGRSYRRSIRSRGPLLALLVPAVMAVSGLLVLRDNDSTMRGIVGFVLVMFAAPLLTVAGVPLRSGTAVYIAAAAGSAALWLLVGVVASRRATRGTIATWAKFWGEYWVLAASVWLGTAVAMVAANLVMGRALI
jgi:hypothetical protein